MIHGDGNQTRDFTYVDNVVAANLAAMRGEVASGSVINVGGGERISILELYHAVAEALGSDLQPCQHLLLAAAVLAGALGRQGDLPS